MRIPPVADRPIGADEGERVFVRAFELRGIRAGPESGIVAGEIEALVESLRLERQEQKELDEEGFTPAERAEIAAFMRKVVTDSGRDMQLESYRALVDKLRVERLKRDAGLTVVQIQEVADAVTQYYRRRGYVLAQALVPIQEVEDGVVVIQVLEGKLGNVLASGGDGYSEKLLTGPFKKLIDAPVTAAEVESAILTLTDYPGLSAFAVFQPGAEVGTTDLAIRVQDEEAIVLDVRGDNHGTRFTGDNRAIVDATINNLTRAGDRLAGSIVAQFSPSNSNSWSLEYERPLLGPRTTIVADYARTWFDVGAELEELGISSDTKTARLFLRHAFRRSRQFNLYARGGLMRLSSVVKLDKSPITRDDLAVAELDVSFDSLNPEARALNSGSLGFSLGLGNTLGGRANRLGAVPPSRQTDTGEFGDNDFWKLIGNYSRLQSVSKNQTLLLRMEGQWSGSLLTSDEQFIVGGPNNVRAFAVSEFQADSAFYSSLEWTIGAPGFADKAAFGNLSWGDIFRVSFFVDYAFLDLNRPRAQDIDAKIDRFNVFGYGLSLQFNLPGRMSARAQAARPGGRRVSSDRDLTRYWFDVTLGF